MQRIQLGVMNCAAGNFAVNNSAKLNDFSGDLKTQEKFQILIYSASNSDTNKKSDKRYGSNNCDIVF